MEGDQDISEFFRFLQKTRLEGVSPIEIKEYRSALKAEGHPHSTINSYIATVRNVFGTAVQARYVLANPAAGIKKLPEDGKLINPYTKQEIIALLQAARADDQQRNHRFRKMGRSFHLFETVATALFAGLRQKELAFLEWKNVDFERDLVWVEGKPDVGFKPKWYQERAVPLEPLLRQILEPLKKPSGRCFPTGSGGVYKNNMLHDVKRAGKSAGLKKISVHFLRHIYASHKIMHGESHLLVMKWMGHKEPETLLRYVHISPGTNRFRNPSIFVEKDIFALLDAPPPEASKVNPIEMPTDKENAKTGG